MRPTLPTFTFGVAVLLAVGLAACAGDSAAPAAPASTLFAQPQPVVLLGYDGDAMEPFITRDGRALLFNNSNDPAVNTDLHWAERIDDLTFRYRGPLHGANTAALEGVPSTDRAGTLYFVSPRDWARTRETVFRGRLDDGRVTDVQRVPGLATTGLGMVAFDAEVGADGQWLWLAEGRFLGPGAPLSADLVVARRQGAGFERASQSAAWLAQVNTDALEYAPCISADALMLLFTRAQRVGGGVQTSILVARRSAPDQPFGPPAALVALDGFVEAPALAPDERALYYHKRVGARFVLYRATR